MAGGAPNRKLHEGKSACVVWQEESASAATPFGEAMRAVGSVCAAVALSLSCAADQWWVGGASGDWNGDNWASEAGGAGAAWTASGTGWFTTSPSTIDLNGDSPSATRFKTSGFSADNRCVVNIDNSSSTASVLTFYGLNRDNDSDFAFADLFFRNVSVKDASTWGFEIIGGSHWYFGEGSSYSKPDANRDANVFVGRHIATSNTVTVAKGATMNVKNDLYIGCANSETVAATGVVYVAGTLTFGRHIIMGRTTGQRNSGYVGRSVLIVDGGTVETSGSGHNVEVGATWGGNNTYRQTSEIVVRNGGLMKITGDYSRYEWSAGQTLVLDGGTLSIDGEFKCLNAGGTTIVRNAKTTVKNGGVLALGGTFKPNNHSEGGDSYLFDDGTIRAINGISVWTQNPADFTVGEGGMTMDTQNKTITWWTEINKGVGKITKIGSGTMQLGCTSSNSGGWEVKEGMLSLVPNNGVSTRVKGGALTVLDGGTLKNGSSNKPDNGLADTIVLKEGATVFASVDTTAQCIFGGDIEIEGAVNVAFDGELQESVDYPVLTNTGDSAFTDADAARCRLVAGTAHAGQVRFRCTSDGKTIYARRVKGFVILFR